MTITRKVNGRLLAFELTPNELEQAHREHELTVQKSKATRALAEYFDIDLHKDPAGQAAYFRAEKALGRTFQDATNPDADGCILAPLVQNYQHHLDAGPMEMDSWFAAIEELLDDIKNGKYPVLVHKTEVIPVPPDMAARIQLFLNAKTKEEFQSPREYPITYGAKFDDGKKIIVQCCGAEDESSWTQAVLLSERGQELVCSEPAGDFFGPWDIEYKGVIYHVDVKINNEEE